MKRQMLLSVQAIALGNLKLQKLITYSILVTLLVATEVTARSEIETVKKSISANVVFLRHALAPGVGDPVDFIKEDCSTQRNLNDEGRSQARIIGDYLKKSNIRFSEILTSEWCRCIDTAKELDLGQWETFSGLNSFFQGHEKKYHVMDKLWKKIDFLEFNLGFKKSSISMVLSKIAFQALGLVEACTQQIPCHHQLRHWECVYLILHLTQQLVMIKK